MQKNRSATLTRMPSGPDGTFGTWKSDSGWECATVERPWLDNAPFASCIPIGEYPCSWRWSPAHGCNLYHIDNVPKRDNCEIHAANLAEQVFGCVAVGAAVQPFEPNSIRAGLPAKRTSGVTNSRDTLAALEKDMRNDKGEQESFTLRIQWGD